MALIIFIIAVNIGWAAYTGLHGLGASVVITIVLLLLTWKGKE